VWYYVRAPKRDEVEEIFERLKKIAEGAALMTDTKVELEFLAGCYDILPNDVLGDMLYQNMLEVGPPKFNDDDKVFAEKLIATFSKGQKEKIVKSYFAPDELTDMLLHEEIAESNDKGQVMSGSIDLGDVSWNVPFAQFVAATWPVGTAAHSWQAAAASGSEIGVKAMIFAAKALAGSVYDLMSDRGVEVLKKSKQEFEEATRKFVYKNPIPDGVKPKTP